MDWLMAHPELDMGACAKEFGITQGWLSQIVHSDVFQEQLRLKQGVAFHHSVLPIREKMLATAHKALDQLETNLPLEKDPSTLADISSTLLDRLGFSPKAPAGGNTTNVQVNNYVQAQKDEVQRARDLYGSAPANMQVIGEHNGRPTLALPRAVQGTDYPGVGSVDTGASLPPVLELIRRSEEGDSVREEGAQAPGGAP